VNEVFSLLNAQEEDCKDSGVSGSLLSEESLRDTSERHLSFQLPYCSVLGGGKSMLNVFFLVVDF
jgi:hypothetical protein